MTRCTVLLSCSTKRDKQVIDSLKERSIKRMCLPQHAGASTSIFFLPKKAYRAVRNTLEDFRRDVLRRSQQHSVVDGAVHHATRKAKVCQSDARVIGTGGEQKILRLDVAVHHVLAVHVLERLEEGAGSVPSLFFVVAFLKGSSERDY